MELELPSELERAHILVHLDELEEGRYFDESINWLLAGDGGVCAPEYQYSSVRNYRGGIDVVNPETKKCVGLKYCWTRGVEERYGYPRYHLIPQYTVSAQVDGDWVIGIVVSAHIDKEEHCADYSYEADRRVVDHLEGLQTYFRKLLNERRVLRR